ncbi:hypothetical protein MJO47_07210 [Desulfuromonas sp. KJ2020]|uniref:hypothetical protein n=1 Tax=Desulfuromonas sp. KJ2020 TaxID=2919173 RepID=UPI0020A76A2B|nr:hypothetical protein [Desulfuromonas sp. KJ2020]MCP3176890.1 hypothetical protein [Desulfuromonas sp. KJ2020]
MKKPGGWTKDIAWIGTLTAIVATFLLAWPCLALAAKGGIPGKPGGGEEAAGNNLSFPVIWAEGVSKTLTGTPGMTPVTNGTWWYWWGTTGDDVPLSCLPDPDDNGFCDDRIPNQATGSLPGEGNVRAYVQKDVNNVWQAAAAEGIGAPVVVDWIDWGDNLESVDWYTRSQVRTEVVLYQDLATPMLEYQMRHVDGWGIDEVHGLAVQGSSALEGPGSQATVYSPCARLTIQKLLVSRDDPDYPGQTNPLLANLMWDDTAKLWTGESEGESLVNPPIFNKPVYEGGDGPGYYSAEINVKGKVIFGYTWNVRSLNDAIVNGGEAGGDYRITFSLDETCGTDTSGATVTLNTFFEAASGDDPGTRILLPVEEETTGGEVVIAEEENNPTVGAEAVLDFINNLTYIDVRILERGGGGGGGKKR